MKKGLYLILPVVLVAALLGGCYGLGSYQTPLPSGATPAPTPTVGPQIEPQQLIDRKTAETLVGNELKDADTSADKPNSIPSQGMSFCLYDTAITGGRFMQITIYKRTEITAQNNAADPVTLFKAFQTQAPRASASPVIAAVTGIGDEAFIGEPGIHIVYQGYYIIISVGDPTEPANQEILKKAGTTAVDNLNKLLGAK